MSKIRVGINGFGRIGRIFFRLAHFCDDIEVVAINDISNVKTLAHLLKFDSVHGIFDPEVLAKEDCIIVNGKSVITKNESEISKICWKEFDIDVVIESTGKFRKKEDLECHIISGARKVILASPSLDDSLKTIV